MKICFFGCLLWFDCNVVITPIIALDNIILTENGSPIKTENNQNLLIE